VSAGSCCGVPQGAAAALQPSEWLLTHHRHPYHSLAGWHPLLPLLRLRLLLLLVDLRLPCPGWELTLHSQGGGHRLLQRSLAGWPAAELQEGCPHWLLHGTLQVPPPPLLLLPFGHL
jgi:hypothetical protein